MSTDALWMKKISPSIFETLGLSDQGTLPQFPMEEFILSLKESLQLENLSIQLGKMDCIGAESYYSGLGTKTIVIPLSLSPLSGEMYFVMGIDDIKTLISWMQTADTDQGSIALDNQAIVKGLYTYLITQAIDSIMQLKIYKDLSIKITSGNNESLQCFAIDLTISSNIDHLAARMLLPLPLYRSIHSHFTFISPTLENLEGIIDLAIPLSIRTGSVTLSAIELEQVVEGDFLIVRNSFYHLAEGKGSFQMLIGSNPLFQVKKQKDGIKVLDYLYFYNEENMDDIDDDDYLDDDLSDDFYSEDLDEDLDEKVISTAEEKVAPFAQEAIVPEKTNLSNVSITVNLEVARFTLSLAELKKLGPGVKLPVMINPRYVNLIVSGKSIGTGEVIEIGDTIGVKVTSLNS